MNILISGWYFFENPKVLEDLKKLNREYPVFVVSHQTSKEANEILKASGLDYQIIPNIGLDWGCYDWYLKNIWDKKSNILFMHDDIRITNFNEFDQIAELEADQYYIFQNEEEKKINGNKHGRLFYLSAKVIKYLLENICYCNYSYETIDSQFNINYTISGSGPHTGFWFDSYNFGYIGGKPPILSVIHPDHKQNNELRTIRHYNCGITHFNNQMKLLKEKGYNTLNFHYAPGLFLGRRNYFKKKLNDNQYEITNKKDQWLMEWIDN